MLKLHDNVPSGSIRGGRRMMEMVREGQITLREAAGRLKRSERQEKRIWARYRLQGDAGLLHSNQGKAYQSMHRCGDPGGGTASLPAALP
jgi:hypothetical protein